MTESDEAFARRLQAQELGLYRPVPFNPDAQTPLMRNRPPNNDHNPTVINARMNEITSSWTTVGVICTVNLPQVLATLIVLSVHWNSDQTCDESHRDRWKIWAIVSALRMLAYTVVIFMMQYTRVYLQDRPDVYSKWRSFVNTLEGCGLIWFVLGNMWLFGEDPSSSCTHPEHSPIYNMCLAMLIFNYIQFCLPCIAAIILIPIFCFCTPCLIRLLARLNDPRATQGASQNVIDTIPIVTVTPELFANGQENTCPICISEMNTGDTVRSLRCHHIFHQQCVDEWLRVNGSCPLCRKRIMEDGSMEGGPGETAVPMTPLIHGR